VRSASAHFRIHGTGRSFCLSICLLHRYIFAIPNVSALPAAKAKTCQGVVTTDLSLRYFIYSRIDGGGIGSKGAYLRNQELRMKKTLRMAVLLAAIGTSSMPMFALAPTGTNPRPQASFLSVVVSAVLSLVGL
jgi:hypothetical protein